MRNHSRFGYRPRKRELFTNLAQHLDYLADAVERAIANGAANTSPGRKTYEPFPQ